MKIVFVACVGQKLDRQAPAKDLYQSVWFKKAKRYAEAVGDQWYILSAKYGILSPSEIVFPYDETLNRMKAENRRMWALKVYDWIRRRQHFDYNDELIFLAGKRYREPLCAWLDNDGYTVLVPMAGLGIGQQLAWLDREAQDA